MNIFFNGQKLRGRLKPPSDKSLTHRAFLIGALNRCRLKVYNPLFAADTMASLQTVQALGTEVKSGKEWVEITPRRLVSPALPLDCRNSGTTARLLCGLLAAKSLSAVIDGDRSLRRRPMMRVARPLEMMGARFNWLENEGLLPLKVESEKLKAIDYALPEASAQVKSAILFAALPAEGETTVVEEIASRDHTERLLALGGVKIEKNGNAITLLGGQQPELKELMIPGDFSSAAFFIAGACLLSGSELLVEEVNFNPTRIGLFNALKRMGAKIEIISEKVVSAEPVATLRVCSSTLQATVVSESEIAQMIDEIPLLALAASQAEGTTEIRGLKELRFKESDRLALLRQNLLKLGARVELEADNLIITGPCKLTPALLEHNFDHRFAMFNAIVGLLTGGTIQPDQAVAISYPRFYQDLRELVQ